MGRLLKGRGASLSGGGGSPFTWPNPTSQATGVSFSATSGTITLTNIAAGDVVCVSAACNAGPVIVGGVTSPHLIFTKQAEGDQSGPSFNVEMWTAIAGSALTNETITVTQTGSGQLDLFALSQAGADTVVTFDLSSPDSSNNALVVFNTTSNNSLAIVSYRLQGSTNPTPGSGWTANALGAVTRGIMERKSFTSPQASPQTATMSASDPGGGAMVILSHDPHDYTVTEINIDGGNSYYATVTPSGGSAIAATYPASRPGLGLTFSNGWDSLNFFPMGSALVKIDTAPVNSATMYDNLNWNTVFTTNSDSVASLMRTNGLSLVGLSQELFSAGGGGYLPNNGGISLATELVGLYTFDEPGNEQLIADPIAGIPLGGGGTITNAIQDVRFWSTGFLQASALTDDSLGAIGGGTISVTALMTKTYPTPGVPVRKGTEVTGTDAYMFPIAQRPQTSGQTVSNLYARGNVAMNHLQMAKGSHQGNWIDYMRAKCGFANRRPLVSFLSLGNARTNVPYEISQTELNWETWEIIIHGGRMLAYFDHQDTTSLVDISNDNQGGMACPGFQTTNVVSFDGTISGNILTVTSVTPGAVGTAYLTPGMQITAGTSAVATIRAQLSYANEATFLGKIFPFTRPNWSAATTYNLGDNVTTPGDGNQWQSLVNGNLNVTPGTDMNKWGFAGDDLYPMYATSVTGTIPIPSILTNNTNPFTRDVSLSRYLGVGQPQYPNGAYAINRQYDHAAANNDSMSVYCPGMKGTYMLDATVSRTGPMTAKSPNVVVLGAPVTNTGTGSVFAQVSAMCRRVSDMARVINSNFAIQYIRDATNPRGYIFPSDTGYPGTFPPKTWAYGANSTGVDCMAKHFTGSSYLSAVSGETISAGYYIFATTRNQEDSGNTTVFFHINDPLATSITVIGEARSITFDSGTGTQDVVFHDDFPFAWTVHIYRVNH